MGSLIPGAEGEGRLCTGYGALDDSWSFMEGEGVFTESRGLEPYYLDLLNRKYAGFNAPAPDYIAPGSLSHVPLGRQAIMGEDLGTGAVLAQARMSDVTYRDQPEAIEKHVGRQPESNLWRADTVSPDVVGKVTTFAKDNPIFTLAMIGGVGLLAYWYMKRR